MKKSFMTRALATGLSVAMAFSLTAVTNVSTASAAVKPAMKASAMTVKEGKSRTYLATAKTLKTYKITKAVVKNASAKQYISVKKNAKGTGIVVTGKKGGTTGRKIVITFKNKTTKKTTTLTTKVVVKAVEKEEALAMTAAATGVKTITVTFNKAVASKPAITLTKGSATTSVEEVTWNDAATEATIKTSGKLTQGTYTVSTTVESQPFTADVVVEKNETLTSFALVGTTLKAVSAKETTSASIEYKALNQYGEAMNCSTVNVTVAPGEAKSTKTPTASSNGKISVTNIPTLYAIAGSKFSVVIVDASTGVNLTAEAVYGACAKATKVEAAGLYNKSTGKIASITAGDKVANYEALFTVTDQYGDPYTVTKAEATSGAINVVAASGVTNVGTISKDKYDTTVRTVNNVEYFAVPLNNVDNKKETAVAGDFSLTLVNNQVGIIGTSSYTVAETTVISSIDISTGSVYDGQSNSMTYSVTDSQGNAITSYDTLQGITFSSKLMSWSKNADGTAALNYDLSKNESGSGMKVITASANEATSGKYLVKSFTLNVLAKRYAKNIIGVYSSFANSTAVSGASMKLNMSDLKIEDQYGNLFTVAELKAGKLVDPATIFVTGAAAEKKAESKSWTVSGSAMDDKHGVSMKSINCLYAPATSSAITGTFKVNIVSGSAVFGEGVTLKMYKIDTSDIAKVTELTIESVNAGYVVSSDAVQATLTNDSSKIVDNKTIPVVVSGKVDGHKVYITNDTAEISVSTPDLTNTASGTGKITVHVSTTDGVVTLTKDFTMSKTASVATSIAALEQQKSYIDTYDSTSAKTINATAQAYEIRDQYGAKIDETNVSTTKYTFNITGEKTDYTLTKNSMNGASIQVSKSVSGKITVELGDQSFTYDMTFEQG